MNNIYYLVVSIISGILLAIIVHLGYVAVTDISSITAFRMTTYVISIAVLSTLLYSIINSDKNE